MMTDRDLALCFRCQFNSVSADDDLGLCVDCKDDLRRGNASGRGELFVKEAEEEARMERERAVTRERGW